MSSVTAGDAVAARWINELDVLRQWSWWWGAWLANNPTHPQATLAGAAICELTARLMEWGASTVIVHSDGQTAGTRG